MAIPVVLLVSIIFLSLFLIGEASYFDAPRIHFKGKFRADIISRNAEKCNLKKSPGRESDFSGTSEWEFMNIRLTSVVDSCGIPVTNSPLLGANIQSNDDGTMAKPLDLDIDWQITSLHGLKVSIISKGEVLLRGDWAMSIIGQDMWDRMPCDAKTKGDQKTPPLGTISTSRITNIQWLSDKVNFLRDATNCADCTGELAVSISLGSLSDVVHSMGDIVGTIGIARDGEPLNVGGSRILRSTNPNLNPGMCRGKDIVWTNIALAQYFEGRNVLALDISNAFPFDPDNKPIDLGELWLGVLDGNSVILFGDPIPYRSRNIWNKGGILEFATNDETLQDLVNNNVLVVAKEVNKPKISDCSGENIYPTNSVFQHKHEKCALVLLKEELYYVRPMDHYHNTLEYLNSRRNENRVTMLVTKFGYPSNGASVKMQRRGVFPPDGVAIENDELVTDFNGIVTFIFKANAPIPTRRYYNQIPCPNNQIDPTDFDYTLPIDGQLYHFDYHVSNPDSGARCSSDVKHFDKIQTNQMVSFRALPTVPYEKPYAWVEEDCDRCSCPILKNDRDLYFIGNFFRTSNSRILASNAKSVTYAAETGKPPRPLFGYNSGKDIFLRTQTTTIAYDAQCTKEGLMEQLQQGVELEFSTLPLYLTSYYTIINGEGNTEAGTLIMSVIMQEMLHLTLAANTLIAIGGKVIIDDVAVVPQYPATGLPGGVLPSLTLTLEKYTLQHIYDNFMKIEVPSELADDPTEETIGEFYREIQDCMTTLQDGEDLFADPRENWQVEWPGSLDGVGTLNKINNLSTANASIAEIIEQGEGASEKDPVDHSTGDYAHYFRFEEIYCQHELVELPNDEGYEYSGDQIPYNADGVVNMKDGLSKTDIADGTECYNRAQTFHKTYRSMLKYMDEAFNGDPNQINYALGNMYSLSSNAQNTLEIPLNDNNDQNKEMCGPVWDYEWDD